MIKNFLETSTWFSYKRFNEFQKFHKFLQNSNINSEVKSLIPSFPGEKFL